VMYSADFSGLGASQYTVGFYDQHGVLLSSTAAIPTQQSIIILGHVCHIEVLADSIYILVCDGEVFTGQGVPDGGGGIVLLKFSAVAPTVRADFLSAVEITGTGSLTLGSEALRQFGLWHRLLGGALLSTQETNGAPTLRVGSLGASGQGGIETIVGGPEYIGELPAGNLLRQRVVQAWPDNWTMPWLTSSNRQVSWTMTGHLQGSTTEFEKLRELSVLRQEVNTTLSARFDVIGATQALVEVFNGPTLVGSVTLPVGDLGSIPSTGGVRRVAAQITDGTVVWILTGAEPWDLRPANGSPVLTGDRLRISSLNPQMTVEGLRSLTTRGANVESFALKSFNTAAPQQPRLHAPRLIGGSQIAVPLSAEPDVSYDIEHSSTVNGPWTKVSRAIGTDGTNETSFFDVIVEIPVNSRFYRARVR